jgi:DNA recombination protein RmuC
MTDTPLNFSPEILAFIILALIASVLLGWLLGDRKSATYRVDLKRLNEESERTQAELILLKSNAHNKQYDIEKATADIQSQLLDIARLTEREEQTKVRERELQEQLKRAEANLGELRGKEQHLNATLATEQEARQQEQRNAEEKLIVLNDAREQLLKEFENLSQKIFEKKTAQFAEQSQQGINTLLSPFREQLDGLKKKVEEVYVSDVRDRATLKAQITELHTLNQQMSAEAHALTTALRGEKKTQGNWGELVLETVLEKSGLREGQEFVREQSLNNDDGKRFRPDVVINLPDDKHIVVDSKVSLNAYTDYVNAEDDSQRDMAARRHCEAIKQHIRSLSDKAYQQLEGINSPDFVFMFMPVEPAFMLAFQQDDALFNEAFERRIVVVTPTTLLATLRTVASIWAIERRNKSTEKLAEQAGKIYDKLAIVVDRMETLGKQLGTAQNTYDDTWKALKGGRGNLVNQAAQFTQLGIRVKKELSKSLVEDAQEEHERAGLTGTTRSD